MRRAQSWRTNRARSLRSRSTAAEGRLWSSLRNRQLAGLKFVRQAPIGPYFVDFLCRERKIIVEVDGGTHSTSAEMDRDVARASYLQAQGYRIFRAHNAEVSENIEGVLETLLGFIEMKVS
jgi:very-short-patch-repair endonuclease